ncbi:hypothetical protein ACSHWB_09925 [Lentzea sp. HUAS TT2]|uniref:DUF7919 family protein n=1 Tax=Lentzea sp. HUAS TT2 TaxID=3447454 RepID=UPI003F6FE6B5
MTTYEDLTPYEDHPYARHGELNIGWLGEDSVFERGQTSQEFKKALTKLVVKQQVHVARGFHRCDLCGAWRPKAEHGAKSRVLGNSEIRVKGENGTVYAAPSMIVHHVEVHEYVPPQEFIEAVLKVADRRERKT